MAESGIIVSRCVLTAWPDEAPPRPREAIELSRALRAASDATAAAPELAKVRPPRALRAAATLVVPATALVDCVPLTDPPEVLTKMFCSAVGSCQKRGATTITT